VSATSGHEPDPLHSYPSDSPKGTGMLASDGSTTTLGVRPRPTTGARRVSRPVKLLAVALVAGLAATACSSGSGNSSAGSSSGGSITIADVAPFTGADAALGPIYYASCLGAAQAIKDAGGVLGKRVNCKAVDTRGDPADAVPAARQMFASTNDLGLVIGLTSDEAASVVPIINSNKMVMFGMTGESEFDSTHFDYFYRLVAPDMAESYALVAIAQQKGYKKVALAFGNDIGSQTFVKPAISALGKAGISVADNETLDLKASTFRTEASKIVASHPDAIFIEALGPASASFLSEVKQLNGGKSIPIVATSACIDPSWFKAVSAAIGAKDLAANFVADNTAIETTGPAYQTFKQSLLSQKSKVSNTGNFETYLTAPGAVHLYDGINLAALAMVAAKSTKPKTYRPFVESIGNGTPGAVEVHSFAEGVAALKAGKAVHYVGPGGPTNFDSFHDSTGLFEIDSYDANGNVSVVGKLSAAQIRAYS
jgi:branched-chain amino acid transport system substrate-binding protein